MIMDIIEFWNKFNSYVDACIKTKSNMVVNMNEDFKEDVVKMHKRYFTYSELRCLVCKSTVQKAIDELCLIRHDYERYTPQ